MSKGKTGYGSARPTLQRKLTPCDKQRAQAGRSRREKPQEEPPWWQRQRTPSS
jgi:hypothetical protein